MPSFFIESKDSYGDLIIDILAD